MKNKVLAKNKSFVVEKGFSVAKADFKRSSISFGLSSLICAAILMPTSASAVDCTYDGSTIIGPCSISSFGFGTTLNAGAGNFTDNTITMTSGNLRGSIMGGYENSAGTTVSGNTVNMENGTVSSWIFGGWSNNGDTIGNKVVFGTNSSTPTTLGIMGGISFLSGNAIRNSIVINRGTVNGYNIAGYAPRGNATGNSITLNNGTVNGYNVAGWTVSGDAVGNQLFLNGGTSTNSYAGYATSDGNATDNKVLMTGGTVNRLLVGGLSFSGNIVSGNKVTVTSGTVDGLSGGNSARPNLAAGFSENAGTVSANITTISGGTFDGTIVGGYSLNGLVTGNFININNNAGTPSFIDNPFVAGGYSRTGSVTSNIANITGGTFAADSILAGGFSNTGSVTGNTANISGGTFGTDSILAGGYSSGAGAVTGNTANISGGTFEAGSILAGGYSTGTGSVTGNTVIIDNITPITLANANLRGGVSTGGGIVADNRLVIKSAVTVDSLAGFEHLEFHIQDHDTPAMLTATNMSVGIDITATKNVEIYIADRIETLRNGDQIKLLVGATPITGTANNIEITAAQGIHVLYDLEYRAGTGGIDRHLAVTNASAHPHSRSFVEGRLASFAFMNQGTDLIVGQGISSALSATEATSGKWAGFTALSVGSSHYDTGGDADGLVNFEGLSMLVGLSKSIDLIQNDLLLGAFFEVGDGSIDANNRFSSGTEINTDGNTTYYGGGILLRINNTSGIYGEGFIRVGTLDTDYTTDDIRFAVSHDTSSIYYGAGVGLGYQFKGFNEDDTIDVYGRYSYVQMRAEDVIIDSIDYRFDDINSHQARLGVRYDHKDTDYIFPYFGAAYEYEFDGDANGKVAGNLDLTTPSLKGNTGVLEMGVRVISESNSPLSLSFDVEGYIGEREGVTGNIEFIYSF